MKMIKVFIPGTVFSLKVKQDYQLLKSQIITLEGIDI